MTAKTEAEQLIEEARRHDKAATPGPWRVDHDHDHEENRGTPFIHNTRGSGVIVPNDDVELQDLEFCAFARTALPKMAEMLEEATQARKVLDGWVFAGQVQKERDSARAEAKRYREALEAIANLECLLDHDANEAPCPHRIARSAIAVDDHEQG